MSLLFVTCYDVRNLPLRVEAYPAGYSLSAGSVVSLSTLAITAVDSSVCVTYFILLDSMELSLVECNRRLEQNHVTFSLHRPQHLPLVMRLKPALLYSQGVVHHAGLIQYSRDILDGQHKDAISFMCLPHRVSST